MRRGHRGNSSWNFLLLGVFLLISAASSTTTTTTRTLDVSTQQADSQIHATQSRSRSQTRQSFHAAHLSQSQPPGTHELAPRSQDSSGVSQTQPETRPPSRAESRTRAQSQYLSRSSVSLQSEPQPRPVSQAQAQSQSEPQSPSQTRSQPRSRTQSQHAPQSTYLSPHLSPANDSSHSTLSEPESQPRSPSQPQTKTQTQSQTQPQTQTQTQPLSQPQQHLSPLHDSQHSPLSQTQTQRLTRSQQSQRSQRPMSQPRPASSYHDTRAPGLTILSPTGSVNQSPHPQSRSSHSSRTESQPLPQSHPSHSLLSQSQLRQPDLLLPLPQSHPYKTSSSRARCANRPAEPHPTRRADPTLERLRGNLATPNRGGGGGGVHAYLVSAHDRHGTSGGATGHPSEARLEYVTGGFAGSEGTAIITRSSAVLWTDGRYSAQADSRLSCDWRIIRQGDPAEPGLVQWLASNLRRGARVAADPLLVPAGTWSDLEEALRTRDMLLVEDAGFVDRVWAAEDNGEESRRPPAPVLPAYEHLMKFAGKPWQAKISDLRSDLRSLRCSAAVLTSLTEIAWLLNIRGRDTAHTPVLTSYLVVTGDEVRLFADAAKAKHLRGHLRMNMTLTDGSRGCLYGGDCVKLSPYEDILGYLRTMSQVWKRVLLPAACVFDSGVSQAIYSSIPDHKRLYVASPVIAARAVKNPTEREGMRRAHVRDAAAVCEFLAYLEEQYNLGYQWNESTVALELDRSRRAQDRSRGVSFKTIAAYGAHGAMPHYETPATDTNHGRPSKGPSSYRAKGDVRIGAITGPLPVPGKRGDAERDRDTAIGDNSTMVLDSGGQYLDGTTDVTRTVYLGSEPSRQHRDAYTRVLRGHVALARAVFPAALPIRDLDILARGPQWRTMNDYTHGTGHGIGSFLSVHESPLLISYTSNDRYTFKEGHFFSNEPGYYEAGNFGVRLENILEVVGVNETTGNSNGNNGPQFLSFRDVTLVPYEPKLIDYSQLSSQEKEWLNEYNARVRTEVGAELKRQLKMKTFYWMMEKTKEVSDCNYKYYSSSARSTTTHQHYNYRRNFALIAEIFSISLVAYIVTTV